MRKLTLILCAAIAALSAQSASAHTDIFRSLLGAATENPPVPSPGMGTSLVTIDFDVKTMRVETSFVDLIGTTTAAHIHCCINPPTNVGVATMTPSFSGFPLGVMSGAMDTTFDMTLASSYNPSFVTANGGSIDAAFTALTNGIADGRAYFNIHTTFRPGGEIRGYYTLVPEPSSLMLMAIGMLGLLAHRRNR